MTVLITGLLEVIEFINCWVGHNEKVKKVLQLHTVMHRLVWGRNYVLIPLSLNPLGSLLFEIEHYSCSTNMFKESEIVGKLCIGFS